MALENVSTGGPHVAAHNEERQALNAAVADVAVTVTRMNQLRTDMNGLNPTVIINPDGSPIPVLDCGFP